MVAIYRKLRERGAQQSLLSLLDHADANVKVWAAARALEFAPNKAERVLDELRHGTGIASLNAEYTLREWRKGTLSFP